MPIRLGIQGSISSSKQTRSCRGVPLRRLHPLQQLVPSLMVHERLYTESKSCEDPIRCRTREMQGISPEAHREAETLDRESQERPKLKSRLVFLTKKPQIRFSVL